MSIYEISSFLKKFQDSPECQLSIINLLIPVLLKVKSRICVSGLPAEQERSSGRVGEEGKEGVEVTPDVHESKMCGKSYDGGY